MTPRDARTPLEFRALGTVDLRSDDGRDLQPILRGPKRLAVFAYLALARPAGYQRRDILLGLFWPELPQRRARHALRNVLHVLRRSLGEEVIVTRGDEEVGLAADALWCDATAVEDALTEGRPENALELYRGDLLEGFFAPGIAPEFEQWLDTERTRLRERTLASAWELAERAEAAADPSVALQWTRRAVQLAPLDESGQRRLIGLLDRLGDRSGALSCYEVLRQRLAEEYELEPAPETQALIESIRQRDEPLPAAEGKTGLAEPPAERGEPAVPSREVAIPDATSADPAAAPRRANPLRRRHAPSRLWAVLLLLGLLLGGTWTIWQLPENGAEPSATRMVVLPFTVRGAAEHAYLGEGLVDLLSSDLDIGEVRTVSPHALLGFLRREGVEQLDLTRARAVSEHFRADYLVLGEVLESGGRLRINASLYERRQTEPLARVVAEGGEREVLEVVRKLATELLGVRGGPWGRPSRLAAQTAARTTASLPALRAYLEGERAFRAGRYSAAIDAFQRATAEDRAFALAFYRLSLAAEWDNRYQLSLEAAERAVRFADRLHPRDRLRLEALRAERRGDAHEAERRYRALLGAYPDDPDGWWGLAEVLFHYGPAHGRSLAEARYPFERVLELEPDHREALWHLARIAAREGRYAELDSLIQHIQNAPPEGDLILEMLALRAFATDGRQEGERIIRALAQATDYPVKATVWNAAVVLGDLDTAERVARLFTDAHRSADVRATGHVWAAHLQFARGSLRQARAELQAVAPLRASTTGLEFEALFLLAPFLAPPRHELEALRARLLAWDAEAVPASVLPNDVFAVHDDLHPLLRLYLLGLVNARLGDHRAALDLARRLEHLEGASEPALVERLARSVRAEVERLRGDAATALALLEEPELHAWYGRRYHSPFFSQARERYLRAEILAQLGRHDEALRLFASFEQHSLLDLIYRAPSHLRRAEIHELRGEQEQATAHHRRFRQLWEGADAELRKEGS
jgi:DNA-binding SARP family transcriptional activator/TolB-like protein